MPRTLKKSPNPLYQIQDPPLGRLVKYFLQTFLPLGFASDFHSHYCLIVALRFIHIGRLIGNESSSQSASQPVSQSASQPVSQSASQPVSQSASQPVSQSASQPVSQSASQPVSQSASQPVSQSASQPVSQSGQPVSQTYFWIKRKNQHNCPLSVNVVYNVSFCLQLGCCFTYI